MELEFPRIVHKPDARLVVTTQPEYDAALAEGWRASRRDLVVLPDVPAVLSGPLPRRPGRPRTVTQE